MGQSQASVRPWSRSYRVTLRTRHRARSSAIGSGRLAVTAASNAVIDIVHAGKLDEAEAAARDLLVRFPEVHDGYDRLGMVYEARGDKKQAAVYYRQVIDFVRARPDQYEPGFDSTFQS